MIGDTYTRGGMPERRIDPPCEPPMVRMLGAGPLARRARYLREQVRWLEMRINCGESVSPEYLKTARDLALDAEKPLNDLGVGLSPDGQIVSILEAAS